MVSAAHSLLPPPLPSTDVADEDSEVQRYYQIAGMTIGVSADLEITDDTFAGKFSQFEVSSPVGELIRVHHHFSLPSLEEVDLGEEIRGTAPWLVYRRKDDWLYVLVDDDEAGRHVRRVAVFTHDYMGCRVYGGQRIKELFPTGHFIALALLVTDQILLAPILGDRQACYVHSSGAIFHDKGLLFVGHSQAGKSTAAGLLPADAELLCDDRNIIRRWPEGFRVHGTWSHGTLPIVSPSSAPLAAIIFLRHARRNRLERITDIRGIAGELLPCVIRPLITNEWWGKTLDLFESVAREVSCFTLEFDKSGQMWPLLEALVSEQETTAQA